MSQTNITPKIDPKNKESLVLSMDMLAGEPAPIDRYEEYLSRGIKSKNSSSDPRNLFDDSNREDRNWLKIAKKFLRKSFKP
jgi:hypothetical protein